MDERDVAYNALAVIAKTRIIRDFLEVNDPMALSQVEDAMLALKPGTPTKMEGVATAYYRCRDIGYGVETGEVYLPALDNPDTFGKRPYHDTFGRTVYLFDDELEKE